ncbi:MAG: lytic transglycosylase domain-containing protein [Burkholderiaceae bacterium]|nr:lytic transglycosylase domain-containing protein [Burkholderiaceae bacterium]MDO9090983.1 lytic transglycosylase domain-containing protein [Burkholderiaceae bacterium]
MSALRRLVGWAVAALALLLHLVAQADVWGYVDERGVAHFASEQIDERYELFFRGEQAFDTLRGVRPRVAGDDTAASGGPDGAGAPGGAGSVPDAPPALSPRLVSFFEVSPGYKRVKHHLREAAELHQIDFELLQALIVTESGFDAQAVSPKGAIGLMQLMPATAQRYGVSADRKTSLAHKLTDARTNIAAGTRYLRYLMGLFPGRLDLVLAAYNAGEGAVQRAGQRIPDYRETQNYVRTVMQLYAMLKPPAAVIAQRNRGADARTSVPSRVRMELSAPPPGGARGRGNMIAPLTASAGDLPQILP